MSRRRIRRSKPTTDGRSPDQRLEALLREPNRERALRTLGRIRSDLDANPDFGPWISAARTLSERLIISEDAFYYFVEIFSECLVAAACEADGELLRIYAAMEEIERAHGLQEDEAWYVEKAPAEWRALTAEWDRRADAIVAASLRELGHADVAAALERDRDAFDRRTEQGCIDVWGEDDDGLEEAESPVIWDGGERP